MLRCKFRSEEDQRRKSFSARKIATGVCLHPMREVELWRSAADLHYPHLPSSLRTWVCTGKQQDQLVREEGEEQSQTAEGVIPQGKALTLE
jgi:hypothetical protein